MPAPMPTRATTNLTLSMGMTTIPLAVFSGVDKDTGITRAEYDDQGRKVGRVAIAFDEGFPPTDVHPADFLEGMRQELVGAVVDDDDAEPGEDVPLTRISEATINGLAGTRFYTSRDVLSCVDTDAGLVAISDAEVETLNPYAGQDKTAEVLCFQPHAVMASGAYLPVGVSQVRPAKRKNGRVSVPDAGAERAFAILLKAMRKHGVFALVRIVARNKPQYAALLPTGRMYTLAFDDMVREDLPLPKPDLDPNQVRVAETLVETMIETSPRVLEDELTPLVADYIDQKANDGKVVKAAATPAPVNTAAAGDLMAQLQASVEAAKTKAAKENV